LTGANSYSATLTRLVDGSIETLSGPLSAGSGIHRFRVLNNNAGVGSDFDHYVNQMSISGSQSASDNAGNSAYDDGWDTVFAAWMAVSKANDKDAVLVLLTITVEPAAEPEAKTDDGNGEAPPLDRRITLIFAEGGAITLDVECVDMALADLGVPYGTALKPDHNLSDPA